jgi:Domain of unknown function (DUF4357)
MEAFLENLEVILPIVGLNLLKPTALAGKPDEKLADQVRFEIRHESGVKAYAIENNGEFVVLAGSQALKDPGYATNSYARLKEALVQKGVLAPTADGKMYTFTAPYPFKSPSAADSVVLDRNTNGRTRWHVAETKLNYHEWPEQKARSAGNSGFRRHLSRCT